MQTNKSGKAKWNYIFIAATAGVMIWLLSQMQDPEQVWQTLRTADPRYLLAALGCMVAFWVIEDCCSRASRTALDIGCREEPAFA